MTKYLALGLYAPIVFFSGYAVWMIISRLLLPALIARRLDVGTYAIAISACLSLLAHAVENTWYGVIRWNPQLHYLSDIWGVIGLWKIVILSSSFFAVLALEERAPTGRRVATLLCYGAALWVAFTWIATRWV